MIVFVSLLLLSAKSVVGQTPIEPISNHPLSEECGASDVNRKMMQTNPVYMQRMQQFESQILAQSNSFTPKSLTAYRIPVVVHVIHKGEALGTGTNVSDADIQKAIRQMNERFRKSIPGLGGVDIGVEFALAVRDPGGQCTNGITRVDMSTYTNPVLKDAYMVYGVKRSTTLGISDAELKAITSWDQTKYYNIFLVSEFDDNEGGAGVQGYAYYAGAHGMSIDGTAMLARNFTGSFTKTTTHELGHALNIDHTFEGDSGGTDCPPTDPTLGDQCADTPPHKRSPSNCDVSGTNPCDGNSSNSLFATNYMDYSASSCANMFTADQRTRARNACSVIRTSFFAPSNMALVPVNPPTIAFSSSKSIVCNGESISFMDNSLCVPNTHLAESTYPNITFLWTFTNGSVTLTSTNQNPTINFTASGSYDVTLTITTPAGTSTLTKPNYIVYDETIESACVPSINNLGNYGQTISKVQFNAINSLTSVVTNSYQDLSCSQSTFLEAGQTYPLSLTVNAGPSGDEYFKVYIDYNNDGQFASTELIYSNMVTSIPQSLNSDDFQTHVTIPTTAVRNTFLRMRVIGERGEVTVGKFQSQRRM